MDLIDIIKSDKAKKESETPIEHLRGLVVKNRDYVVFALDLIPKDFSKITKKDIMFLKKMIIGKNLKQIKSHYNANLTCQLDVYLEDTNQDIDTIIQALFNVFNTKLTIQLDKSMVCM